MLHFKAFKLAALAATVLAGAALTGCVTTQEMPLAANAVRLDTSAKGALFVGHASDVTMQKAAEATLRNGYQYFRLEQVQMGQGQMLAGVNTFGSGSMYGNSLGNSFAATAYGSSLSMPVYAPTASVGVTVVMFHARDAGAKEAFSAADVLARLGKSNS